MNSRFEEAPREEVAALARLFEDRLPGSWDRAGLEAQWAVSGTSAFVLREGEVLVSAILVRQVLDEAEILALASRVLRSGHARRLLEETRHQLAARGVERLFLEVAEDNPAAIALYETSGFGLVGRRRGYYRSGADARLYARPTR